MVLIESLIAYSKIASQDLKNKSTTIWKLTFPSFCFKLTYFFPYILFKDQSLGNMLSAVGVTEDTFYPKYSLSDV